MGGNPAVSTLILRQMRKSWFEGLESATATFLNTLTAADNIDLGDGVVDTALGDAWNAALADLQFIRSYNLSAFAVEKYLYRAFATATDETGGSGKGRPLFPMINPTNTNGTARSLFTALDLGGVRAFPSWALTSVSVTGSDNNSWLFDPDYVHGYATGPQEFQFPGTNGSGAYSPVAFIDLAIFGYKAFANTDIAGVRQVIYDPTA